MGHREHLAWSVETLLEQTHSRSRGHHPVGEHVEIQAHQLEDVFKQTDDLKRQHVLDTEEKQKLLHKIRRLKQIENFQKVKVVVENLSTVISNFKDGRLPADFLGLLFAFPFIC